MDLDTYGRYDALGLAELVKRGEVTPKELAMLALKGIEVLNPTLQAVVDVYRERIDSLDSTTISSGPFRGVPFLKKRAGLSEAGMPAGDVGCTRLIRDPPVSPCDSFLMSRIKHSGLVTIGDTVMPEMGATVTVETEHKVTRNPWDHGRIAGGSSTGAAVAVAAGMVPMAHANDAGGSIRFPASCNGLIGLKCSRGRISFAPDGNDLSVPLASQFAVTRTVRDTAALLDALQGPAPGEAFPLSDSERTFSAELGRPSGRLRIALSNRHWHSGPLSEDIREQIEGVAKQLEKMGHHVDEASPSIDYEAYRNCFLTFYYGMAWQIDMLAEMVGRQVDAATLQPVTFELYWRGKQLTYGNYQLSLFVMNTLSRQLAAFFEHYDLVLTPALAEPVPELGVFSLDRNVDIDAYCDRLFQCSQFLQLANLTGTPAISLPLRHTRDGLPLGAHFMAPMGGEALLLRLAAELEEAMPWRDRRPASHVAH